MVIRRSRSSSGARLRAALTFAVLAALGGAPAALAQQRDTAAAGLDKARAELGELRYLDALATLDGALEAGTSSPAETAQIHLLLGEVQASLGHRVEAEKAFERALAIDPGLELRKGVSPKISRPFRKARRARRGQSALAISHQVVAQDPPTIAVLVQSDSLRLVAGARVTYWTAKTPKTVDEKGTERIQIALPAGASRFTVAAIDQHGNRVAEIGSAEKPLALEVAAREPVAAEPAPPEQPVQMLAEEPAEADGGTPFYASWMLWGGVAVAIGAAGTWAGLSAQSAKNELDDIRESEFEFEYSEAKDVADRAEQRALIANLCFGAAGASAIASAVLFIRSRDSGEERATVAPLVGQDQVGMAAWLRF
jgi:tetratricopeptide (TPR) repeat protein